MKTYYPTVSTVGLQAQDASWDCCSMLHDPLNTVTPVRCFKESESGVIKIPVACHREN